MSLFSVWAKAILTDGMLGFSDGCFVPGVTGNAVLKERTEKGVMQIVRVL
ncbi:hypothetical protein [Rhodohalobacter sp.]